MDESIKDFINSIYLFGSAVRKELMETSDIDIFIDCSPENEKNINGIAKAALSRFYKSKDYDKWRLLRFTHDISLQVGKLEEWKLKSSIMSEGIVLYSKKPLELKLERMRLISFKIAVF